MAVRVPNGSESSTGVREARPRGTSGTKGASSSPADVALTSDKAGDVVLSPSVRTNSDIHERHEEARAERIAKLQRAIDDGAYKADRAQLADRLVDEELARKGR